MSKKDEQPKDKKAKSKGKGKGAKSPDAGGPSVANHPRARAQVRRAKAIGGLVGFALAAYVSMKAGVPTDQVGLRALGAGIVGYLLAWAASVTVWRHLVIAELRALLEQHLAAQHAGLPEPGPEPEAGEA